MKREKSNLISKLKFIISIAAVVNLAVLLALSFLPTAASYKKQPGSITEQDLPDGYSVRIDTDPLVYDGTASLDLLDGISFLSPDGTIPESKIFANIREGASPSQKLILYSVDTEDGKVSVTRGLELENYSGPSITLPEAFPEVEEENLDSILDSLPEDSRLSADDGYGNDITGSIIASYTRDKDQPILIHYTFTVTNLFNDTVSVDAELSLDRTRPVLSLTQDYVTLDRGSYFEPADYVEIAADTNGAPLFDRIHTEGTVSTDTPGTYVITYTVTGMDGTVSVPKELLVVVQ